MITQSTDTLIIGAGISGLVVAHRLKKNGLNALLLESTDRAGGVIQSLDAEGFLLERGPNSLRGTHTFLRLVDELNLRNKLVKADPKAPAYVYFNDALHAVPISLPAFLKTRLLSTSAKLRLLQEPFIRARKSSDEESLASFVQRRLGAQVLERLVAPFVSGVYAGDVEKLSVQASLARLSEFEATAGSILRGAIRAAKKSKGESKASPKISLRPYRLCSFQCGLQQFTDALSRTLGETLLTEARVERMTRTTDSQFEVVFSCRAEQKIIRAKTLVMAATANIAAQMLYGCAAEISELIADIPYTTLAAVPLAYRCDQVAHRLNGFGFLAPRNQGVRTLGSIWNSSLFAGRAPDGWVLFNNFIGGETDREAIALSDEELIRIVHQDLKKVLGISGEPLPLPITRWQRAIPQYVIGHAARVAKIEAALHNHRGLWLAGNYLRGVALGDCMDRAEKIAEEITEYLTPENLNPRKSEEAL